MPNLPITNDVQYERAKAQLIEADPGRADGLRSDVEEYEDLRDGTVSMFDAESVEDVGAVLVRARIARGWSQAQMASTLGVSEEQARDDEATGYRSVELARVQAVADALGLSWNIWAHFTEGDDGPR